MRADITKILTPNSRLPTMPSVAMQLVELARRPNAQVSELSSLLSKDPAMAGTILRYVNSPAYSMEQDVESLERAVVIMGIKSIMNIALSFTLADSLRLNRPQFARYLPAIQNGYQRGTYEQQTLSRRIQDRGGQTDHRTWS